MDFEPDSGVTILTSFGRYRNGSFEYLPVNRHSFYSQDQSENVNSAFPDQVYSSYFGFIRFDTVAKKIYKSADGESFVEIASAPFIPSFLSRTYGHVTFSLDKVFFLTNHNSTTNKNIGYIAANGQTGLIQTNLPTNNTYSFLKVASDESCFYVHTYSNGNYNLYISVDGGQTFFLSSFSFSGNPNYKTPFNADYNLNLLFEKNSVDYECIAPFYAELKTYTSQPCFVSPTLYNTSLLGDQFGVCQYISHFTKAYMIQNQTSEAYCAMNKRFYINPRTVRKIYPLPEQNLFSYSYPEITYSGPNIFSGQVHHVWQSFNAAIAFFEETQFDITYNSGDEYKVFGIGIKADSAWQFYSAGTVYPISTNLHHFVAISLDTGPQVCTPFWNNHKSQIELIE